MSEYNIEILITSDRFSASPQINRVPPYWCPFQKAQSLPSRIFGTRNIVTIILPCFRRSWEIIWEPSGRIRINKRDFLTWAILLLEVTFWKVRMRSGWVGSRWRPPVNDGDMKNESPASGRISMSSAADPASRPRVRHTLISELFFSLLDMGTKGLLGSKLKPVRSSWPYENGSWIILDHQGEAVRLSEDVLTKEFHGLLIHLGLGSPNSRFRHGAPALHCSLQGRQTPGIAQASPTLAHPLEPRSRSLGCTSEAYLQRISLWPLAERARGIIMAEYPLAPYSPD